jgi:hypothetical protein
MDKNLLDIPDSNSTDLNGLHQQKPNGNEAMTPESEKEHIFSSSPTEKVKVVTHLIISYWNWNWKLITDCDYSHEGHSEYDEQIAKKSIHWNLSQETLRGTEMK